MLGSKVAGLRHADLLSAFSSSINIFFSPFIISGIYVLTSSKNSWMFSLLV